MKKYTCFFVLFFVTAFCATSSFAQLGYITTIAGNGSSGFSGDGGPATLAQIGQALGAHADGAGNLYIDDWDNGRIRKVTPAGNITTIAGGGGSTADGIPATAASLSLDAGSTMAIDAYGNIYVVDGQRIRKITVATGIITTVTGTGIAGFSGDGGPATAAQVNYPGGICFDPSGNMYIGDGGNSRIRKINTAGIISTYAGTGVLGYSGDGGPATAAQFYNPDGVCIDLFGNLYCADELNYRIRKITPSGIVTTYAGSGSSGLGGDGGPATGARFSEPSNVCSDSYGNLYIADFHNSRIRKVDLSGIVTTFAGGGSSLGSGVPATSASFSDTWGVSIDLNDNIYVCDRNHYMIRMVNGLGVPTVTADSFKVVVTNSCSGMSFRIISNTWSAGQHVKTYFGNGLLVDTIVSAYGTRGIADLYKPYNTGTYTVKHVLYGGATAIDSITYSRYFSQCQDFSLNFFYDANSNCVKDITDAFLSQPVSIEVDSSGIAIDTISATSGSRYTAYGTTGTVYKFHVLSMPAGFYVDCPATGFVFDTIGSGINTPIKYIGLTCSTSSSFDLSVYAVMHGTALADQYGAIYVQNAYCMPENATVSVQYSPKYDASPRDMVPAPTSQSGNTMTWDLSSLSSTLSAPVKIVYGVWNGSAVIHLGDTIQSHFQITPVSGDTDPSNNTAIIIDTVKGSLDPNEISVLPSCVPSGATANLLQYTINFENTGNDTAHNIYVMDTLPDNVDISSMRLVLSSHEMYTSRLKDALGHNILKFDFPSINLLDSSHHGQCDGAVIFTINSQAGLADGGQISNQAGIYFDINPVVMTNTVATGIGNCPVTNVPVVRKQNFQLYPNPATDELTIKMDKDAYNSVTISNSMGQVVETSPVPSQGGGMLRIDVSRLPVGLYYVTLRGESGSVVEKFVKNP